MKKAFYVLIFVLITASYVFGAGLDTLPNDLGKKVESPEGLKKIIESKAPRFVIVDVRPEQAYQIGHIPTRNQHTSWLYFRH